MCPKFRESFKVEIEIVTAKELRAMQLVAFKAGRWTAGIHGTTQKNFIIVMTTWQLDIRITIRNHYNYNKSWLKGPIIRMIG